MCTFIFQNIIEKGKNLVSCLGELKTAVWLMVFLWTFSLRKCFERQNLLSFLLGSATDFFLLSKQAYIVVGGSPLPPFSRGISDLMNHYVRLSSSSTSQLWKRTRKKMKYQKFNKSWFSGAFVIRHSSTVMLLINFSVFSRHFLAQPPAFFFSRNKPANVGANLLQSQSLISSDHTLASRQKDEGVHFSLICPRLVLVEFLT